MLKHNYGDIYLRRMKPTDKADSLMTSVAMAAREAICRGTGRKPPLSQCAADFLGRSWLLATQSVR